ncbi:ZYBA0S08-04390g1_1 [Zygosaccharomyces bailii CLIB 213]|uniref:Mannosyl-oligosaccharide glucosidase n=1 Tax=Zygosaccharomyces bailii (strain CLIB 213 / ATCC 58445 / CBS 680 / BCRC 21525 / NBRC 1098 / NCYC 1416 / NRRL Y-2227) TaxID=1333698 RepID=A0A8J2X9Z9_ZYGB2|nr:ZYBA0S08-04390g1_1 [Zygosaccharomyces bailii CLIB 213]
MEQFRKELVDSTVEEERLRENREHEKYWYRWGPYLSERSWATVREDYSYNGDAWSHFPFEHANARVFRWGEDGLFGVSDNKQLICMNVALWNGKDERLKERLFGLTNSQGNHGEDVKELYFYLDNTPTHSYMKSLYKYPFAKPFPYEQLVKENGKRGFEDQEFEIYEIDGLYKEKGTGDTPYFDVVFEMAKGDENPEDLNFRITVYNRSKNKSGSLHVAPQLFFRNVWAWKSCPDTSKLVQDQEAKNLINVEHHKFGGRKAVFQPSPTAESSKSQDDVDPYLIFTDNESNLVKLFGNKKNPAPYTKDAVEEFVVQGNEGAVNPAHEGTKAAAVYYFEDIPPGEYVTVRYKFTNDLEEGKNMFAAENMAIIDEDVFDAIFADREEEADNFYWRVNPLPSGEKLKAIQRQAFAGLLWTKQFYNFTWEEWYNGDVSIKPPPPKDRAGARNKDWKHLYIEDVLSMPDKWEYPFFASWDTAFHTVPIAMIDPDFAKKQLDVMTREWYMHPNGQMPAYEWNFSDVNPPVHVWAVYRVYKIERNLYDREDRLFLERVFQKLLLNFTWWVNRKDSEGNNVFEGGFLGLDNIGVFNRSEPLPTGGKLEQADSTGWMAFFCLQMLNIALELAIKNPVYEDIASKFFEHFILISDSLSFEHHIDNTKEGFPQVARQNLWNEEDQFYYDAISWGGPDRKQLPVRSLVGLIPLYASMTLEPQILERFPSFKKRVDWFIENKSDIVERNIASMRRRGVGERMLLALVNADRLKAILKRMLDETEFLSTYGIRSLSKYHEEHPFEMHVNGCDYVVKYLPAESDSGMFGGNSNWRGPIWFPTSFLLVEALQRFHLYYGDNFKVECPTGSGEYMNLAEVAVELGSRMIQLFTPNEEGERACYYGDYSNFLSTDEYFKDLVPFFEYFDGDTGRGLGASHQCGWTALVAKWISDVGVSFAKSSSHGSAISSAESVDSSGVIRTRQMRRRKSGRSLLSFTATALDLTEEEKHCLSAQQSAISPQSSRTSAKSASEVREDLENEEDKKHDLNSSEAHKSESKLINILKNKIGNFKFDESMGEQCEENKPELACQYK